VVMGWWWGWGNWPEALEMLPVTALLCLTEFFYLFLYVSLVVLHLLASSHFLPISLAGIAISRRFLE
jgi:hypothetical protein